MDIFQVVNLEYLFNTLVISVETNHQSSFSSKRWSFQFRALELLTSKSWQWYLTRQSFPIWSTECVLTSLILVYSCCRFLKSERFFYLMINTYFYVHLFSISLILFDYNSYFQTDIFINQTSSSLSKISRVIYDHLLGRSWHLTLETSFISENSSWRIDFFRRFSTKCVLSWVLCPYTFLFDNISFRYLYWRHSRTKQIHGWKKISVIKYARRISCRVINSDHCLFCTICHIVVLEVDFIRRVLPSTEIVIYQKVDSGIFEYKFYDDALEYKIKCKISKIVFHE